MSSERGVEALIGLHTVKGKNIFKPIIYDITKCLFSEYEYCDRWKCL
jgi:hypothetical protein